MRAFTTDRLTYVDSRQVRALSCWLSISHAPESAGALQFSVGSHRWGYLTHVFDDTGALTAHGDPRLLDCEFATFPRPPVRPAVRHPPVAPVRPQQHRSSPHRSQRRLRPPRAYRRGSASQREGWLPIWLPQA
ncbi:phytanoyl-CoA dioxygenase family protein [Nocardia tengchongensis]|uniref:phytanoyl-CoA dioxygenase family protein n=1 Tax=Nocardia tengchongensis TaxID=2055889 RepID=UPI0036A69F66